MKTNLAEFNKLNKQHNEFLKQKETNTAKFFLLFPCYLKIKAIKDLSMSEDSRPLGQFY